MSSPQLSLRSRIEHSSVPIVDRINALPRAVPFVVVLVVMVSAVVLGRWGAISIAVVAVFVAWLLFLTWPRLTAPEKMLRLAVLAIVAVAAVVRAFPLT